MPSPVDGKPIAQNGKSPNVRVPPEAAVRVPDLCETAVVA